MTLSLVVPCYNEEGNVKRFFDEFQRVFAERADMLEYVFVDDGSRDKTYSELKELHKNNKSVRVLSFSKNFGKDAAIYAGLSAAKGDLVCIVDADLQQRPEVVLEMLDVMKGDEEIDCVAAYQQKRKESKLLSAFKSLFYKLINKASDVDFKSGASDFRMMKRAMVDAILEMTEFHRFSKGIFSYVGFNTKYIPYVVAEREAGTSKWGFRKLLKYAFEGIIAFSTAPLKFATYLGLFSAFASVIYAVVIFIQYFAFGISVAGYATTVILILLIGGMQLLCLGIAGSYIGKIYIQTKNRPVYFLRRDLEHKTVCDTLEGELSECARSAEAGSDGEN